MIPPHVWFTPVPTLFWSEYAEAPFSQCVDCECELQGCEFYLLQKCYVGTEPVFEFAICNTCRANMSSRCSEETNRAVQAFLLEYLRRRESEFKELTEMHDVLRKCVEQCLICNRLRAECHRYTIGGLCSEQNLVVQQGPQTQSPLMICQNCEASMSGLVSKQTRDTWDRFVEENFDGPPGVGLDVPGGTPVLI
ncbi:MAG: hypothetical protein MK102_12915 [Fuerstiella sp.]|nr:hypothetical protein [Fuerstiella sp.]